MDLKEKKCVPCEGGIPPLTGEELQPYLEGAPHWEYLEGEVPCIRRVYRFKNFRGSWEFFDKVANLAEEEGHHPDILVQWNRVTLTLTTHAIKGLSENDFILAAKINALE
ncbi:MAG TPA: 4a-hydroxytetrahydrobiopterin dehydratase [Synergistales bacterium]|nr:4a-hydroxytetrahydrobiopterin dehydratase [Synergistales bacterium]